MHLSRDFIFATSPILIIALGLIACVAISVFTQNRKTRLCSLVTTLALFLAILTTVVEVFRFGGNGYSAWQRSLVVSYFSEYLTVTICVFGLATLASLSLIKKQLENQWLRIHIAILVLVIGALLCVSTASMLTLYVGIEIFSLASIVTLALFKSEPKQVVNSYKLLIANSVASLTLLYGFVLLYGLSGSLTLGILASVLQPHSIITALAVSLVVLGFTAKLGIAPLGCLSRCNLDFPAPLLGWFSSVGLAVGYGIGVRLLGELFVDNHTLWLGLASFLAASSLLLGALLSLRAKDLYALIVDLSLVQAGVLLTTILTGLQTQPKVYTTTDAVSPGLLMVGVYGISIMVAVSLLVILGQHKLSLDKAGLSGLANNYPLPAFLLIVALGSLAGILPLMSGIARFLVLGAAFIAGYGWLSIVIIIASGITAFALIQLIMVMYLEAAPVRPMPKILQGQPKTFRVALTIMSLSLLFSPVVVKVLYYLANNATRSVLP